MPPSQSDVQVAFRWNKLHPTQKPELCGVYAITSAKRKEWYYIGKSQNIAKRLEVNNHPFQVTKDTELDLYYWYLRVDKKHVNWVERYLIKEHDPEWNGGTSFDGHFRWLHCEARLPLTEEQILERSAHLRGIWGD
jgi:excinuclease UvrABC nuclease subunit